MSFKDCKKGNHDLIEILSDRHSWDETEAVVRWCTICGSIVVDCDYDNRTNAGYYMKMRRPSFLMKNVKKEVNGV